ncbi:MAG TPA: hypothetical protein VG537_01145 [Candidatus Kapabacteria bacterium]|jgi:hypothetical protein|nr:hypothetical protein [Candidatus Kapabacteria bacterium]
MAHLRISILFFALCFTSSNVLAQGTPQKTNGIPNLDSLLSHIDIGSILHQVNVDSIVHTINVDSIMHKVNIDSIMHKVNIDSLMGRMNYDSVWKANKSKIERMFGSVTNSGALHPYAAIFSEHEANLIDRSDAWLKPGSAVPL